MTPRVRVPRTMRLIGALFALSLLLTACDLGAAFADAQGQQPMAVDAHDGPDAPETSSDAPAEPAAPGQPAPTHGGAAADESDQAPGGGDPEAPGRATTAERADAPEQAQPTGQTEKAEQTGKPEPTEKAESAESAGDRGGSDGSAGTPDSAPTEATPAPQDGSAAGGGGLDAIEREIFGMLNAQRAEAGLAALDEVESISQGAEQWSCGMAERGTLEHAELRRAGVNGENIAVGQRSAVEVTSDWNGSAGHFENRMQGRWTEYGVGVCEDDDGRYWFTERFR